MDTEEFITQLLEKFDTKVINLGQPKKVKTEYDILGLDVTYVINKEI